VLSALVLFSRLKAPAQAALKAELQPDIIPTGATPATAALQQETRTIPIVSVCSFAPAQVADPLPLAAAAGF
jgi:hypothetical protein